jgi:hypothetical protein
MTLIYLAAGFVVMLALMFLSLPLLDMMGGVVWGTLNNSVMTAIPLFMLLGELLLRGGIADKMFDALSAWLGRLPPGRVRLSALVRGDTLAAVREHGLRLDDAAGSHRIELHAADTAAALGPQDLVIVAVKGPALPAVA